MKSGNKRWKDEEVEELFVPAQDTRLEEDSEEHVETLLYEC